MALLTAEPSGVLRRPGTSLDAPSLLLPTSRSAMSDDSLASLRKVTSSTGGDPAEQTGGACAVLLPAWMLAG